MNIIDEVKRYVKEKIVEYKNNSLDHYDFWEEHIKYVYKESLDLAVKYNANKEIVALGALLHDIALIEGGTKKDHHIVGADITKKVLVSFNYSKDKLERVVNCVYNHRSSKNATCIEEICVCDADILAHFDNIPMLFYTGYIRFDVSINNMNGWIKKVFEKDYEDLSDKTKKDFEERYKQICDIVLKK